MGYTNNKKKKRSSQKKQDQDQYDVKRSFKKLNQKGAGNGGHTESDFVNQRRGCGVNSSTYSNDSRETFSMYMQMTDSMNTRFDSLSKDISGMSDKIGNANSKLRSELDKKIETKVSNKLFTGAVSALLIISGLIYQLSYRTLIEDTGSNSKAILWMDTCYSASNKKLKNVEIKMDTLIKKTNKIESDILKIKHK